MAWMDKLQKQLQNPVQIPVYYFASTEAPLLREAALMTKKAIAAAEGQEDITLVEGPAPSLSDVIEAAGTISFFGTRRVVEIRELSPSTMVDKDVEELCTLFTQLQNAVLVVTALYKDKKTATSKKAKALFAAAEKAGFATELAKPTRRENVDFLNHAAAALGANFAPHAADALLERAGEDRVLLQSETEKLAALSAYRTISEGLVNKYSVCNIEADVFELARQITSRRKADAFAKLQDLLALRHEPIAIAAALAGTFVDMYRARCGTDSRRTVSTIFTEMGYKGNNYRMQKAKENAARYSTAQLEECVLCLADLDIALKSSALPDKSILLQAALGNLLAIGAAK
ncbi:DNA polymerase III subunit delta [Ruminococcaceae bacterium OttesenSCG-928-A16]|nr:DNA polymerase III subunit delta [Ruminococcaceae bacterium OttesenSCG-928-A16]